jgi:allantoicase
MFNSMENQLAKFRQQAAAAGFSGTGIVDVHPDIGVIRLKLNTVPPESLRAFTDSFSQMIALMLGGLNVQVKMHTSKEN